jgi:hypothetical protein
VVQWVKDAMTSQNIRGTLIVTSMKSNGAKDRLHRRGHRDTVIIVPKCANKKTNDVIYWFHGCNGFGERTFKTRLMPQLATVIKKAPEICPVIVIPEMPWSHHTKTRCKRQLQAWRQTNQFYNFTQEAEAIIRKTMNIKASNFSRIVIGHSAGGSAIAAASLYGGLCRTKPTAVVFSDATYGSWFDYAWKSCLKKVDTIIEVYTVMYGKPSKQFRRWTKRHKSESSRIEAPRLRGKWWHTKLGDNAILLHYMFNLEWIMDVSMEDGC